MSRNYEEVKQAFMAWAERNDFDPTCSDLRDAFFGGVEFVEGPEDEDEALAEDDREVEDKFQNLMGVPRE